MSVEVTVLPSGLTVVTDAMAHLIGRQPFHAFTFEGRRHDCGSAAGFVLANLAIGLDRADIGPVLEEYLATRG